LPLRTFALLICQFMPLFVLNQSRATEIEPPNVTKEVSLQTRLENENSDDKGNEQGKKEYRDKAGNGKNEKEEGKGKGKEEAFVTEGRNHSCARNKSRNKCVVVDCACATTWLTAQPSFANGNRPDHSHSHFSTPRLQQPQRHEQQPLRQLTDQLPSPDQRLLGSLVPWVQTNVMDAQVPRETGTAPVTPPPASDTGAPMLETTSTPLAATIAIVHPTVGEVLRSNSGMLNIVIAVHTEPASSQTLQEPLNKIFLDGKLVASGTGTTFQVFEIDRGTHTLVATANNGDQRIQQSQSITFTLLRHSTPQH
jgi:hypothetical protein